MKKLLLGLASLLVATQLHAEADFEKLQQDVKEKLGMSVHSVAEAPIANPKLLQVSTERGLLYMSEDLRYLFFGKIYDTDKGFSDLTEQALSSIRKDRLKELKTSTIDFVAKDQKHEIFVFTDVSCGYCRKLHNEIESYTNAGITVRYLAFPRGGERSKAFSTMNKVWCAKDQGKAMTLAKADKSVDSETCKSPVAEHYNAGAEFAVTGTPAIILSSGELISGYLPAERLLKSLDSRG